MFTLRVNGQTQTFDGDPSMPLLWYLRDELGLTGTKFGCGVGACGACTVHIDGEARRSCRPRRFSNRRRIRRTPTSTERCMGTSAAVGPISAFAPPSSKLRERDMT